MKKKTLKKKLQQLHFNDAFYYQVVRFLFQELAEMKSKIDGITIEEARAYYKIREMEIMDMLRYPIK